jgi:hypothetical protein
LIFNSVANPFDASVLLPVEELFASLNVSEFIAIVVDTPLPFTTTMVVPIGRARAEFAGIVNV